MTLDSVSSIGTMGSSGLGPETLQMVLRRPGYVISEAGATYELTLDATIHAYEHLEGAGSGEHGAPETLADTMVVRVGADGVQSRHPYANRFPLRRIGEVLRSRG